MFKKITRAHIKLSFMSSFGLRRRKDVHYHDRYLMNGKRLSLYWRIGEPIFIVKPSVRSEGGLAHHILVLSFRWPAIRWCFICIWIAENPYSGFICFELRHNLAQWWIQNDLKYGSTMGWASVNRTRCPSGVYWFSITSAVYCGRAVRAKRSEASIAFGVRTQVRESQCKHLKNLFNSFSATCVAETKAQLALRIP